MSHINSRDTLAYEQGNTLVCAAMGLSAIADLIGADGAEHALNSDIESGLAHAAKALALLVQQAGHELCEQFDPDHISALSKD